MIAKLVGTVTGTVTMQDGTTRPASRNTYRITTFADGGATFTHTEEIRIEFVLFTNRANGSGARYRKTTAKQAATFVENAGQ